MEASLRVAGEVEDYRLEHLPVGNAQMVAVERHQDGGAAGEADHAAFVRVDLDPVIGAERLAQREQQRGDVILDRVAHGEAQCDPDQPGAAQHRAEQGRCADHVEGDHEADNGKAEPDRTGDQFGEEAIGCEPVPHPAEPGNEVADEGDRQPDAQSGGDQREHADEIAPALGEAGDARAVRGKRQVALEPVFHRDHARHAIGDRFGARDVLGLGNRARERDHAFLHFDLDRREGGQFGKDAIDPLGNAAVVARILRRGDRLDRGRAGGRFGFGGQVELRRKRHRPEKGEQGGEQPHSPATDMPSMRKVGTSIPRSKARSLAGTNARNISGSVPAIVISATGPASSPLRIRNPLAPRL